MRFVCVKVSVEEGITLINRGQEILEGRGKGEKQEESRRERQSKTMRTGCDAGNLERVIAHARRERIHHLSSQWQQWKCVTFADLATAADVAAVAEKLNKGRLGGIPGFQQCVHTIIKSH